MEARTEPRPTGRDLLIRRSLEPGDAQSIVELHRRVYPPHYRVDESFVGDIDGTFAMLEARGWPGPGDAVWIVEGPSGAVAGSLILTNEGEGEGRVRLFVFEESLRGQGLGRRLLGELLASARSFGYERLTLATFADLRAAAHLYREAGFRVVTEDRKPRWGRRQFNYQHYELRLR